MQTEGAIRQKLKQVKFRHQKRLIEALLARKPPNCKWNGRLYGPSGHDDDFVLVCRAKWMRKVEPGEDVPFRVCDDRFGGVEIAQECPWFEPKYSKEAIKASFKHFVETATLGKIAERYPDMAALMWVLNGPSKQEEDGGPEPSLPEADEPPKKKSWWARLWAR